MLKNFFEVSKNVANAAISERTSDQEYAKRKEACFLCREKDSKGKRLFRITVFNQPVCGAPRLADLNEERIEQLDGCGCFLNLKWSAQNQKCPLRKW